MLWCAALGFHHRVVRLAHGVLIFEFTRDHLAEMAATTRLWTNGLELLVLWDSYFDVDIGVDLQEN